MEHGREVSHTELSSLSVIVHGVHIQTNIRKRVSTLYRCIICDMIDHTSLILNVSTWRQIFGTCMKVSVCLSCWFVHEQPYHLKPNVLCCNPIIATVLKHGPPYCLPQHSLTRIHLANTINSNPHSLIVLQCLYKQWYYVVAGLDQSLSSQDTT